MKNGKLLCLMLPSTLFVAAVRTIDTKLLDEICTWNIVRVCRKY